MDDTPPTNWSYNPQHNADSIDTDSAQTTPTNLNNKQSAISWSASEYISHEKSLMWYLYLSIASIILCGIVYLITRDRVAVGVIGFSIAMIGIYAHRTPKIKNYTIDAQGVRVDTQLYMYSKFKSFSVIEDEAILCVWLKPLKKYSPPIAIYLAPGEENKIIQILGVYLPHEENNLASIDKISKQLKF